MKPKFKVASPVDSIIIDLIMDHFNIQSLSGRREILTGEEFQEICNRAEQLYYDQIMITTDDPGVAWCKYIMSTVQNKINTIKQILHSFPDSQMGLYYLIDLGKASQENYPVEDRVDENFIHGCTSNAWIKLINKNPIKINTVSDSQIISGILYLLEDTFNGEPKSTIDEYSGQDLIDGFGLVGNISAQRLRGFAEAVRIMKEWIQQYQKIVN